MPKNFEVSEMRVVLGKYLEEMQDILTTSEDVAAYAEFMAALYNIHSLTVGLYQAMPDGKMRMLDPEMAEALKRAYRTAISKGYSAVPGATTGPMGERMEEITDALLPLLENDLAALETVDVEKETMSLPELIAKARAQAVDMGDQEAVTVGGMLNTRQHIIVANNGVTEAGFFTPTVTVDPEGDFENMISRMKAKNPVYRPLLDAIKKIPMSELSDLPWIPTYERLENELSLEEKQDKVIDHWFTQIFPAVLVDRNPEVLELMKREDFLSVMDELGRQMVPVAKQYESYKTDNPITLRDGANVDRRNIGVCRVAKLLGKKNLVAEARPMMLIRNGKQISGTFMAEATGFNINAMKPDDPMVNYGPQVFENPEVFGDIAAMQVIDFITGGVDRNTGNFFLRFEPREGADAKLVGLTMIDNDATYQPDPIDAEPRNNFVRMEEMGVIGEEEYNAMCLVTTKEQFALAHADLGLSQEELEQAWLRKEALQKKISEDKEFFEGKPVGYTKEGRIRVVKKNEWKLYSIQKLAQEHKHSQFNRILGLPKEAKAEADNYKFKENKQHSLEMKEKNRRLVLGLAPEPERDVKAEQEKKVPVGVVVGSGIAQDADSLQAKDPNTLKLAIPAMSKINTVGGQLSRRYPITWMENGSKKEAFFAPKEILSVKNGAKKVFDQYFKAHPKYENELMLIYDYYSAGTLDDLSDIDAELTKKPEIMKNIGFTDADAKRLAGDEHFIRMIKELVSRVNRYATQADLERIQAGIQLDGNSRVDLKNVLMTDVAEELGAPNVLARSRVAQVESDGRILEGIVMDKVDGVDFALIESGKAVGHPMARITSDMIGKVYNTEGLKDIADLQIVDYICLNVDRHNKNLFYQFDGLDTDTPKFTGVKGIDNDFSVGTMIPDPNEMTKALPAVNNLSVISEDMAKKFMDPKYPEKLAASFAKRGMSEENIKAAKARAEQIRNALKENRIRVVKKGEWGRGENTIDKLAEKHNYFSNIKYSVIDICAEKAEEYYKIPEKQRPKYEPKEGPTFAGAVKVDDFGDKLVANKELEELREKAEKEFLKGIEDSARIAPSYEYKDEREMLTSLKTAGKEMYKELNKADPWYHGTSRKYKDLKASCDGLESLAKKLLKKLKRPEDQLSVEDRAKLTAKLNEIRNCAAAYSEKKAKEKEDGEEISIYGNARLEKTDLVVKRVKALRNETKRMIFRMEGKDNPLAYAHEKVVSIQTELSALSGDKLRDRIADMLYFKTLTRTNYSERNKGLLQKDKKKVEKSLLTQAVMPDNVKAERSKIKNSPGFERFGKMSDQELRRLAMDGHGEKLVDGYLKAVAKGIQENKVQEARQAKINKAVKNAEQQKKPAK